MIVKVLKKSEVTNSTDILILPVFEDGLSNLLENSFLSETDKKILSKLVEVKKISGKKKSSYLLSTPLSSYSEVYVIGLGKEADYEENIIRQASGDAAKAFKKSKAKEITLDLGTFGFSVCPAQFIEGLILGQYSYDVYKTKNDDDDAEVLIKTLTIATSEDIDVAGPQAGCDASVIKAESTNWARDLGNAPGNDMTPTILAQECVAMAKETGADIEVLDEDQMKELGMDSLLAVSRGSIEEAKLIIIKYSHPEADKTIAMVGKGLTFDAGGISLKPGKGMEEMKFDMCGSVAVLGAMRNICLLKPKVNVICAVPSSENMPAHNAMKPGDIIKAYNGKTIEVYNTDAEGRLILADALSYIADVYKPEKMVDLATLTGACLVCLGHHMAAIMSKDDGIVEDLIAAGDQVHERLWQMPLNDEYIDLMNGKDADLCNIGPASEAGTVTAAGFLSHFVGDTNWAHIDIAGMAWGMKGATYIDSKLASGFGVRLMTQWALNEAK